MGAGRVFFDPSKPHRPFELPPDLDMGTLKLDDLYFDLDEEVARLRASDVARGVAARAARRKKR